MRILACVGLFITTFLHAGPVFALWCGNALIMEDQSAFEVREILKKNECGELLAAEEIGSVREVIRRHDPFLYPRLGFYGHRYHPHGWYYGPEWRSGFGRRVYHSEKFEKWRVRIQNRQGLPYCYDLTFKNDVLRAIGIGDPCGSAFSPE